MDWTVIHTAILAATGIVLFLVGFIVGAVYGAFKTAFAAKEAIEAEYESMNQVNIPIDQAKGTRDRAKFYGSNWSNL